MDVMEGGMTSAEVMKKGGRIETGGAGGMKKKNYKEQGDCIIRGCDGGFSLMPHVA